MGETDWGGNWVLFCCLGAMLRNSLIQFSVEWRGCVPSLLFDLRSNYGGVDGDNCDLLQKVPCRHCYTQCPQPCSRPPPTHASTRDSWTLMGKSGSVSCGVTAPFSWVLVCTRFFCALQESVSPVLWKCHSHAPLASKVKFPGGSVPLPSSQVGKSVVCPRTFLAVWEFLWYNYPAVCGSSARWLCWWG